MLIQQSVPYMPPLFNGEAFNCSHCQAYSKQDWGDVHILSGQGEYNHQQGFRFSSCARCFKQTIWLYDKMLYPAISTAPTAPIDLPEDIKGDYEEARTIVELSPRGASALLRLAIQKLCKHLGEPGKNINDDIASLVKKGLPVQVQQALDIVRVVGNNAVHPGQLDLKDDKETATQLFWLVNLIVEVMITQPKHVNMLYQMVVPESQRLAIQRRDGT
jgi:Domain of unknown function (DUF4145)